EHANWKLAPLIQSIRIDKTLKGTPAAPTRAEFDAAKMLAGEQQIILAFLLSLRCLLRSLACCLPLGLPSISDRGRP
ncbi:MAG: hypothetical protein ACR2KT_07265, partial [Methylocella sp.]